MQLWQRGCTHTFRAGFCSGWSACWPHHRSYICPQSQMDSVAASEIEGEGEGEGATTGPVTFVHEARTAADAPGQGRLPAITQCPLLTPERSSLCRSPRSINRVAQQRSRALNSSGSTKPQQFPSGKTLERRWPVPSRSSCGDAPCPARACPPE